MHVLQNPKRAFRQFPGGRRAAILVTATVLLLAVGGCHHFHGGHGGYGAGPGYAPSGNGYRGERGYGYREGRGHEYRHGYSDGYRHWGH